MTIKKDTKVLIFLIVYFLGVGLYAFSGTILDYYSQNTALRLVATNDNSALAVTGAACTIENTAYDRVEIQYTLQGEFNRLSTLIPTCTSPSNFFTGEYTADVVTPKGNTYRLGSYPYNNFITCGGSDLGGVLFGTVPNEHTDTNFNYMIKFNGFYYKNKTSTEKFPYSWTESVTVRCINRATDKCADGTGILQCSTTQQGKYCTSDAYLVDRAPFCPCSAGYEAQGGECVLKGETNPPPPPPQPAPLPKPTPQPVPQPSPNPVPTIPPSIPMPSQSQNSNPNPMVIAVLLFVGIIGALYYLKNKKKR